MSKKLLREQYIELASSLPEKRKLKAEEEAYAFLTSVTKHQKKVASFSPLKHEINLSRINKLLAENQKLVLPRVSSGSLSFYQVLDLKLDLEVSPLGILEPVVARCKKVELSEVSLFLVPGVAFDEVNNRLGMGGGSYDRLLREVNPLKVAGIAYKEQVLGLGCFIPFEPTDVKLEQVYSF